MSSRTKSKSPKASPAHAKKTSLGLWLWNRLGLLAVIGFVAFCLVVVFSTPRSPQQSGPKLPKRTGAAWEYDEATNTYWDPRPGHEHWHEGKPPDPADR